MFKKSVVSLTSAAILVAGPGHSAVAAALTMSRGPVAGIAVLPMIGPGMNSPLPNASLNLTAPSALTVPSLSPVIAAVPAAIPSIIQPQANIGTEEAGAALNAVFDNNTPVAGRDGLEVLGGQSAVPASGAQKTLPLSRRMESLYAILAFTEGAMYETRDGRS